MVCFLGFAVAFGCFAPQLLSQGLSGAEQESLCRWLVRVSKDVDDIKLAADRELDSEEGSLENEILIHDRSGMNEWILKPHFRQRMVAFAEVLKPLLARFSLMSEGFTCDGKTVAYVKLCSELKKLDNGIEIDLGNPSRKQLVNALEKLRDKKLAKIRAYLDAIFGNLFKLFPDTKDIVSEEGGTSGSNQRPGDEENTDLYIWLIRTKKDLSALAAEITKYRDSGDSSSEQTVLEHNTMGLNEWFLKPHIRVELNALAVALKPHLERLDSASGGLTVGEKTVPYKELLKKLDDLSDSIEIDLGKADRAQMLKALDKLSGKKLPDTLELVEAIIHRVRANLKNADDIDQREGLTKEEDQISEPDFAGFELR
jgi:hypothetical protein